MTVSAGSTKTTQVCNGSLTDFDFSFAIYKKEDIAVILKHIATEVETVLVLNTDYTVASDDFADGGTVSTIKEINEEMVPYAWSANYSITIMLNLALVQETDLLYGGNFSSEAIELAADRLTRIAQQLDERINRTVKLRKTSALDNIEIDDLEAGKFVIVNAAGDALEMGTVAGSGKTSVSNSPYDKDTWNDIVDVAASKNAIRDELFNNRFTKGKTYGMIIALGSGGGDYPGLLISNEAYGINWNDDVLMAASRNAIYDKIESIGEGSGDVVGPATNTIEYVPQWLSNNSKTLKNGFPITAAGKALIDDTTAAAMRTTLELNSAALRTAEDVLTDGSNLPDGHAIKTYGNANWGSGAGDVVGPASATDNAISLFDGTTGKLIQNSLITVDAAGAPTFPNDTALRWKQVGGAVKNVLAYDLLDNIIIGVDGDDAHVFIERLDTSNAGAPLQSSRMFKIAANYWKTAAAHQRMGMIWHEMLSDNPMSRLHFEVGEENSETKIMSLENDNGTLLAIFQGGVKIEGGSPGVNKVLTSDANGLATWNAPTGGGDVSGPATNTDDYIPQWNGANSKLLKNGFPITAAGKALIDDASVAAQRTTLGLASAALRTAEDTLTDGSNLPDGHAIKTYGNDNWGGGSSKWTDGGTYIYGTDETGNIRLHDSGQLEIGATGGVSAPLISANKWGFSTNVIEGARRLLILDGTEDETSTPAVWLEKLYQSNGIPAGDPTIPVCLYVAHKHTGSGKGFTHSIMAYALNEGTGNNDVIAVSGRARKKGAGEGDSCGIWGSAYNDVNQNGGVMGVEAAIYQNAAGMVAGDRLMDKWSAGLHVSGISLGSPAKAGIAIDAANTHRFWNAMIIDKNCFVSGGPTGTVGINMGSHDSGNHPQYAIKFGIAGTHLYCNSGDLKFYDPVVGTVKTLTQLVAGGGGGLWTDHTTYISPTSTRDVALTGTERFKMAGGVYTLPYGGTDFRVMTPGSTALSAQKYGFNRHCAWSFFATDTDNPDEMLIEMNIVQRSGSGQRAKTGLKINHYSQPDNGGDVSGILALQTGGGGAITCYKTHMMRPSGYTDYSSSQQGALEVGCGDDSQAGLFMSGINIGGAHTHASECIWCRIDNAQSKGILVTPGDGNYNGRQAFAVGDIYRNASQDGNKTFEVKCDGDVYMQDLFMSNAKAISFKNSTGTYKNMFSMQSDNTLRIGWELGAGKLMMNIDGSLKTLSIDGSGFVKAT